MSATVASHQVFEAFLGDDLGARTLYHGHSYGGNALAAAVALRHLALLADGSVLRNVTERAAQLADLAEQSTSLRRQRDEYRERMDELHAQIVTLQAVKTGGELMSHLKDKMKDISERVQKTTIKLVDSEEQMMLSRVQFQDSLAELTLPDAAQHASLKP